MRRDPSRYARAAAAVGCLAALCGGGGCDGGPTEPSGPTVATYVTRDFGREQLSADRSPLASHRSALRALAASHDVATDEAIGVVTGIDGLANVGSPATPEQARRQRAVVARLRREGRDPSISTWVFNVNGIETDPLPRDYRLYAGDVVQWDLRDWDDLLDVRATVGAFPETFTRGMLGDRFPTSVTCAEPRSPACGDVERAFARAGVPLTAPSRRARALPRLQVRRARVFVGAWDRLRGQPWARRMRQGPRYSGVFARFVRDGAALQLLDWEGRPVLTAGAGTGLVAAMRPNERELVWLVTGVDDAGVRRAAGAVDRRTLRNAFALALTSDGDQRLPLPPARLASP